MPPIGKMSEVESYDNVVVPNGHIDACEAETGELVGVRPPRGVELLVREERDDLDELLLELDLPAGDAGDVEQLEDRQPRDGAAVRPHPTAPADEVLATVVRGDGLATQLRRQRGFGQKTQVGPVGAPQARMPTMPTTVIASSTIATAEA